jgi:hypothetical protein
VTCSQARRGGGFELSTVDRPDRCRAAAAPWLPSEHGPAARASGDRRARRAWRSARIPSRPLALILLALMLAAPALSPARAQEPLHGKSVIVTWIEERMQRREGESAYRPAVRQGTFSAYVSTAERTFSRVSMANPRRGASGKRDVVGEAPRRHVSLSGRTMTTVQQAVSGGARRIVIKFDEGFSSCTAEVIRGKVQGADKIVGESLIRPGTRVEIASVKTSGVSCAVKDGNVFGEE